MADGVLWIIQHAERPLLVTEIAERLAVEGNLLHPWDAGKERDRIQVLLRQLRRKSLVESLQTSGDRRLRWAPTGSGSASNIDEEDSQRSRGNRMSDRDWDLVKRFLPPHGRRKDAERQTRTFLDQVVGEVTLENSTSLTPDQIRRFWSWHDFGVWQAVAEKLPHKLSEAGLARVTAKLSLLNDG